MTSYTPVGPFVDDVGPPTDANFFNALEAFLVTVTGGTPVVNALATDTNVSSDSNGNATVVTLAAESLDIAPTQDQITGSAGTATLIQTDTGTWKRVQVMLSGYWNNGGVSQSIALPTPFTSYCRVVTDACYQVELWVASAAQTISVLTAEGAGGGTVANQTYIGPWSRGGCNAAVDTIAFRSGDSAGRTGIIILEGY